MKSYPLTRCDQIVISLLLTVMAMQWGLPPGVIFFQNLNHLFFFVDAQIWINFTMLGDTLVLLCLMAPLLVYRPQWIYGLIAAIPLGGFFSSSLKNWFHAPRPGAILASTDYHALSDVLMAQSFPSGHSITAFAMASVVLTCLKKEEKNATQIWIKVTVLTVAILIACSRIALGVHWPIDVIAGGCLGWFAGLSGYALTQSFPKFWQRNSVKWSVMWVLVGTAIFLLTRIQTTPSGEFAVYLSAVAVFISLVSLIAKALKTSQETSSFLSTD